MKYLQETATLERSPSSWKHVIKFTREIKKYE
jgi:hypothetical protein